MEVKKGRRGESSSGMTMCDEKGIRRAGRLDI